MSTTVEKAREMVAASVSESDFQSEVIRLARARGWRVAHFRPAMTRKDRWVTPMQGDPGFFDLVLARAGRVVFSELKSQKAPKPRPEQAAWAAAVTGPPSAAPRVECYLWRPSNWPEIVEALL